MCVSDIVNLEISQQKQADMKINVHVAQAKPMLNATRIAPTSSQRLIDISNTTVKMVNMYNDVMLKIYSFKTQ